MSGDKLNTNSIKKEYINFKTEGQERRFFELASQLQDISRDMMNNQMYDEHTDDTKPVDALTEETLRIDFSRVLEEMRSMAKEFMTPQEYDDYFVKLKIS